MAQVDYNLKKAWASKIRCFNSGSSWLKSQNQSNICHYCHTSFSTPLLYLNNPDYSLCSNCCAPAITPTVSLPHLKLYAKPFSGGHYNSYPLLKKVAATSGISTALATLCLYINGGDVWVSSFLIGGLTSLSALVGYERSKRYVPISTPYDSVYTALITLERKPDLLINVIPDQGLRYSFYSMVKLLTQINRHSSDPAIVELQTIQNNYHTKLSQAPLHAVLDFLDTQSEGIIRTTLDEIGQGITESIDIILDENTAKEELSVIFAALSLAKKPIDLSFSTNTSEAFDLSEFALPQATRTITFHAIGIRSLPQGFWNTTDKIVLNNVHGLELLPDLPVSGLPETPLSLNIINSSVAILPRSITRRQIACLDLTGSKNIKKIPSTLATQIKNGIVQTLNLTGTSVWTNYQRNFVFNEQVRQLFGTYDPQQPHELFDHRSSVIANQDLPHLICKPTPQLFFILLLVMGVTVPLGLLFMVVENLFFSKDRKTITDTPLFWASYITGSLLVAFGIYKHLEFVNSIPIAFPEPDIDFDAGDTIFDVYNLIQKSGRQQIDLCIYDWDSIWVQIFEQNDSYSFQVPETLIEFITIFIDSLNGKFEGRLGKNFKRFIRYKGGIRYLQELSQLPFYQLVQTLEKDSYRFPVILDAIKNMRSSIGKLNQQYHSIDLSLEDIIETDMPVPDPDPQLMRALFSLIAAGYHVDLSLNWIYNAKAQPLSFDMIPLEYNLDRLCVRNAVLNEVPETVWSIRHEVCFENVSGLEKLPELPNNVTQLPLKLFLKNTSIEDLPDTLNYRPLTALNLENSTMIQMLPCAVKDAINHNRLRQIVLAGTGIHTTATAYNSDNIKQLLTQDIFAAEEILHTSPTSKTLEKIQDITPISINNKFVLPSKLYCYLPNIENWFGALTTAGCVVLGGLFIWQVSSNRKNEQENQTPQLNTQVNVNATTTLEFDFFRHPDFPKHAKIFLGYVVRDAWLFEYLQKFLALIPNLDSGQNWNCYELLYNISTKRLEFEEDNSCQKPRCIILPSCISIRYTKGSVCQDMISALNGQVLNFLLKDQINCDLAAFQTCATLTDGQVVNLRKQIIVFFYSLGYTIPGKRPEDLYQCNQPVCFVRRTC